MLGLLLLRSWCLLPWCCSFEFLRSLRNPLAKSPWWTDEASLPSSVNVSLLIWDRSAAPVQKHRDYEELHLALGTVGTGWRSWADSRLAGWWQSGGVKGCCL